ncbi:MAG: hypothetical protein OXG80_00470, partial [Chloroflexi bacterium]|nr:hypothetical protein [Chloroflexota bacterium]
MAHHDNNGAVSGEVVQNRAFTNPPTILLWNARNWFDHRRSYGTRRVETRFWGIQIEQSSNTS